MHIHAASDVTVDAARRALKELRSRSSSAPPPAE